MLFFPTKEDADKACALIENDIYGRCFHEAGHAVAHILLRRKFSYVRIYKTSYKGTLGCIRHSGYSSLRRSQENIARRIIQTYQAGDIAESFYLSDRGINIGPGEGDIIYTSDDFRNPEEGSDTDMIKAFASDFEITLDEQTELNSETSELIARNWDKVHAVALALSKRKKLKYFEVRKIVLG